MPMGFDVFFISYGESNADSNWAKVKEVMPWAKRIDGIKGIHNAHKFCAEKSRTHHFITIDADNVILEDMVVQHLFNFAFDAGEDLDCVRVYYAKNAVNGLEYGWGGIKIWPRSVFSETAESYLDFTTSFNKLKVVPLTLSITDFATTAENAWRSAYREVYKLLRKKPSVTNEQELEELNYRVSGWLGSHSSDPIALFCPIGAQHAIEASDIEVPINDWNWLHEEFCRRFP
jgi:hypothetical protein